MKLREIASLRKSGAPKRDLPGSGETPGGGWMWGWGLNHVLPWRSRKENLRPLDDLKGLHKKLLLMRKKSKKSSCGKGCWQRH